MKLKIYKCVDEVDLPDVGSVIKFWRDKYPEAKLILQKNKALLVPSEVGLPSFYEMIEGMKKYVSGTLREKAEKILSIIDTLEKAIEDLEESI